MNLSPKWSRVNTGERAMIHIRKNAVHSDSPTRKNWLWPLLNGIAILRSIVQWKRAVASLSRTNAQPQEHAGGRYKLEVNKVIPSRLCRDANLRKPMHFYSRDHSTCGEFRLPDLDSLSGTITSQLTTYLSITRPFHIVQIKTSFRDHREPQ